MTLAQIRSLVSRTTKSDTKRVPPATLDFMINLSQKEIVRHTLPLKKSATITTVADQEQYDLPSDFHKAIQAKVGSFMMEYAVENKLDKLYATTADSGQPYYYYIDSEAGKYGLYPIPSGVYSGKLSYYAIPATMSADSDTPDIPELFHEAIVLGACYRVFDQMNDFEMRTHYYALFRQMLNEIANDIATRQSSDQAVPTRGWDILDA